MNPRTFRKVLTSLIVGLAGLDLADAGDRPKRSHDGQILEPIFSGLLDSPSHSILDSATLERCRDFIANGDAAFREIYWPTPGAQKDPDPAPLNSAGLHIPRTWFFNLLFPERDQTLPAESRDKMEAARWRFVAETMRFLKAKYALSRIEGAYAIRDIPVPGNQSSAPALADKVVSRFRKEGRWFEAQDDGLVLTVLIANDDALPDVSNDEAIAKTVAEYLNLDPDEHGPLKVVSEKVNSMVFGTFTGKTELSRDWPKSNFSPWYLKHWFCSDGKFLFLRFVESEMPEGFQPMRLPERF